LLTTWFLDQSKDLIKASLPNNGVEMVDGEDEKWRRTTENEGISGELIDHQD
jgi:hypothetical protein